jgi:hypothetical protein
VFEGDFAPDGFVTPEHAAYVELTGGLHCFVPTVSCLRQTLEANYFRVSTQSIYQGEPTHPWNRILTTCEPFVGENWLHRYRPPSGLHVYDPRFSERSPQHEASLLRHNGRIALRGGKRAAARRNFVEALRLDPLHLKAYKGLIKTFLP